MKVSTPKPKLDPSGWLAVLLFALLLLLLFHRSFDPQYIHFSNDGPLGQQKQSYAQLPGSMLGYWSDANDMGASAGAWVPSISNLFFLALGPVGYAKFLAPAALFFLGVGAWCFFRQLKLSPLAVTLGALAVMLNSVFFATACWGVAAQQVALGLDFLALALIIANTGETRRLVRWVRLVLAGLCVGANVMETPDIGAIYSMIIAAFVFYKSLMDGEGTAVMKIIRGTIRVGVVAVFAGFIAFQTVTSMIGTQIQGVAGTGQDTETKAQHWDWATQWSLPKQETLGLFMPGLFGYKMDTPKGMMPQFDKAYEGGVYWGGMGRDPNLDRWFDSGEKGPQPPSGFMRFTGGQNYCGILVIYIALWAAFQSFRRQNSPFSEAQKKLIWFWLGLAAICLPLAWGRFAPFSENSNGFLFYALLYKLPYFSTIRNPTKFLIFFSWAVTILFAYGVHGLSRRYLDSSSPKTAGLTDQLKNWWAKCGAFDRKWIWVSGACLGASVLGWLIYSGQKPALIQYLQKRGFADDGFAKDIATFSISQAGWFIPLFGTAILLVVLVISGYFNGPRARIGSVLLGAFLLFDLGRADLPYIIHWDYKQKYEVGSLNPIVNFLRNKPYEHRVAALPFNPPSGLGLFSELYRIEWTQHLFLYYAIQCLDVIQMSRMAEDLKSYYDALSPHSNDEIALMARHWQLTNTRYLLGPAGYLPLLNEQLDPVQHRFSILQRFSVTPKPGILQPTQLEELTAVPNENGDYALFDFTGALPRAKLYSNWQVNTNDTANLKTLADPKFDPLETVLVSTPQKDLPAAATNANTGTVTYTSYSPKQIVFDANATAPSILLLNDRYDANWRVTVDGKPADLLRCNFIMRGVYLPPGKHVVTFAFSMPNKPLYVTSVAFGIGILLCGLLFALTRGQPGKKAQL